MEDPSKFKEQLFEPLTGPDPENVSDAVIQDEMAMFQALSAETR